MSDKQIPVTVSIDEAASRRRMEEQLNRLAQEIGSKATVTLGFRLDEGAIAAQSRRLTSAMQQSLDKTSLKVNHVELGKDAGGGLTEAMKAIGDQAGKNLSNSVNESLSSSIKSAGRHDMPAASRR